MVTYRSAHVDYVESEFIVRSEHSCQVHPLAIEEVRRILLEHVAEARASSRRTGPRKVDKSGKTFNTLEKGDSDHARYAEAIAISVEKP